MTLQRLSQQERKDLLTLARESIISAVSGKRLPKLHETQLTSLLRENGAAFVTLTIEGELRGCIGSLQAYRPLVEDVQEHAVDAALNDYRFLPLSEMEIPQVEIEISVLTPAEPLRYEHPQDLPGLLKPHEDGVVLRDGSLRATFLPQVWDQIPAPEEFLNQLCLKMGAPADRWRQKVMQVSIYHVEEFKE
jgi:AmmeMemoRadiSam system protein A